MLVNTALRMNQEWGTSIAPADLLRDLPAFLFHLSCLGAIPRWRKFEHEIELRRAAHGFAALGKRHA